MEEEVAHELEVYDCVTLQVSMITVWYLWLTVFTLCTSETD